MINKERIRKRLKKLGYAQLSSSNKDFWGKGHFGDDLTVYLWKNKVRFALVCHPYKEGWEFKEAKTTLGAIRIINKYN